ncbi:MAG: hypothetical protein HY918_00940 [Candidatus Doudnabacteria bacterium]|nr:hypothetical protein [Candidatus Doudnabacteria bacterium]
MQERSVLIVIVLREGVLFETAKALLAKFGLEARLFGRHVCATASLDNYAAKAKSDLAGQIGTIGMVHLTKAMPTSRLDEFIQTQTKPGSNSPIKWGSLVGGG